MTRIPTPVRKSGNKYQRIAIFALVSEIGLFLSGFGILGYADRLPTWLVHPVAWAWLLSVLVLPFTAGFVGWRSLRACVVLLCAAVLFWLLGLLASRLSYEPFQNARLPGVFGGYSVWLCVVSVLFALPGALMLFSHCVRRLLRSNAPTGDEGKRNGETKTAMMELGGD